MVDGKLVTSGSGGKRGMNLIKWWKGRGVVEGEREVVEGEREVVDLSKWWKERERW